jgi:hypothetical protein
MLSSLNPVTCRTLNKGREVRGFLFDSHIGKIQQILSVCGLPVLLYSACHLTIRVDVHELQLSPSLGLLSSTLLPLFDLCHLSLDFLLVEFQSVLWL